MYTRKPLPRGFPFFLFYEALEETMAKTCNNCVGENVSVPYIVHESAMARSERHNKRLWIVILVLVGALIGTNIAWIVYESQFEDIVETETIIEAEQDGTGINIVGGGDVNYGAESEDNKENN